MIKATRKVSPILCAAAVTCGLLFTGKIARSEEGMWTFDNPPTKQLLEHYGFNVSAAWLEHVRLSSVRLNDGGSGSFVSPHGLLLTNHHVARGQLQKNSTAEHDYIASGFYARTPEEEMKSPDLEVDVLMSLEEVTARVQDAIKNAHTPQQEFAARKEAITAIERESQQKTGLRSDVVTLYQGGEYWLYRYKKYTDVRLVFAPEQQAAFFGGDPDNFTYPRFDLDMALFRVYENGKPIENSQYLKWNAKGAAEGDLVFVSGHPASTERLATLAQLEAERDVVEPSVLKMLRSRNVSLKKFSETSPEHARQATSAIFSLENSIKGLDGRYQGLMDPRVMAAKRSDEEKLKAQVMANPRGKAEYGSAWEEIAAAERKSAARAKEVYFHGLDSQLATLAARIVQYVTEIRKPDGDRLAGYHESQLESLRQQVFSPAPIYADMEISRLVNALALDLSETGPNDPFIKTVLGGKAPLEVATALVTGTRLSEPAFRRQLVDGGEAAVAASSDPMIVLARKLDPMRRELIKWNEDTVQSVIQRAGEKIAKARFAVLGKTAYPDATFTLRLSYGQVKGYPMNGTVAAPKTTFYGLFDRAASFDYQGPFSLPPRYLSGKNRLDLSTPLNFVTTNDSTGGNSGSPVIDREGQIVGLLLDGNIESLVGDFIFVPEVNRTVAVHTGGMTEALRKLYDAGKLADELQGAP